MACVTCRELISPKQYPVTVFKGEANEQPPPQCETLAKSLAATICTKTGMFDEGVALIDVLGRTVVVVRYKKNNEVAMFGTGAKNARERYRLQKFIAAADEALTNALISQISPEAVQFVSRLTGSPIAAYVLTSTSTNYNELDGAKAGFKKLDESGHGWGAYAVRNFLSTVHDQIMGIISILRGTMRQIEDGLHPLAGQAVEAPSRWTGMLAASFAEVWGEIIKNQNVEPAMVLRSIVEAAVGKQSCSGQK
ncbi:hypothetical protein DFH07DRAFT_767582 [Mycena maculata]|uniref:Uncharacterized protein n=1 Tax=Mycena maculata TaxID=230809 RepID=A0AAD7NSZ1_9AGAR|nr:hypothetical protein DFH07DRAFT_767582 [Mycena maculata]